MNKRQKQVEEAKLAAEAYELRQLKAIYNKAAEDIANKIEISNGTINFYLKNFDELDEVQKSIVQSQIYQKQFQESLQKQINGYLSALNAQQYKSIDEYLNKCYKTGYIGSMYDIAGQGIPVISPIDQKKVTRAMVHNSPISEGLYAKLGVDTTVLKKRIANNIARGISTASDYRTIARNINLTANIGFNKAMRIARTEGHRIQCEAALDAQYAAKAAGADIVKQWDAALDANTRETHRMLDGQIKELDEPFEVDGMQAMNPAGFGIAAMDINCRCALLQRAKWALDADELEVLRERAAAHGLYIDKDNLNAFRAYKEQTFNDFFDKYLKATNAIFINTPASTKSFVTSLKDINNGKAGLDKRRTNLLKRMPNTGDFLKLEKGSTSVRDLAYLSAATNNEFALFRSKRHDVLVRGDNRSCNIVGELYEEIINKGYEWIAHSHVDGGTLMPSIEDRNTLKKLNQESSIIIGIDGREKEFDNNIF